MTLLDEQRSCGAGSCVGLTSRGSDGGFDMDSGRAYHPWPLRRCNCCQYCQYVSSPAFRNQTSMLCGNQCCQHLRECWRRHARTSAAKSTLPRQHLSRQKEPLGADLFRMAVTPEPRNQYQGTQRRQDGCEEKRKNACDELFNSAIRLAGSRGSRGNEILSKLWWALNSAPFVRQKTFGKPISRPPLGDQKGRECPIVTLDRCQPSSPKTMYIE